MTEKYLCRTDHSVEIWNFSNSPFLERTIPGSYDKTIDVICWAGSRLFSVGFSGDGLKEWDLTTLTPKRRLLLTGEKGICMDYHKATQTLAVGTEEGIINIFDVSDEDLQFTKVFDRQDKRVICCKFNDAGDKLVSGSMDSVKVWNVQSGHVIHKMSLGRTDSKQETIVWCINILDDFTIISGDSRGRVTFWDGNLGSQIDYVLASTADIMCLSVAEDRQSFFCSGIEQILKKYTKVKIARAGGETEQWVRCAKKSNIHTHDVLAMVTIGNEQLISGGIDGFLSFAAQDFKHFERAGPFLSRPFAVAAEESRLLLLKYVNYIEVWKLAKAEEDESEELEGEDDTESLFSSGEEVKYFPLAKKKENPIYRMSQLPEKFLELRTKSDEMVVCSTISNDGRWIAYSTVNTIRLFRFELQENSKPKIQHIKAVPDQLQPCSSMIFSKDSSQLITLKSEGRCSIFELDSETIDHKETFGISEHHTDLVHLVEISSCSTFLVMASLCNNVSVWNLNRNKWTHSKTLPRHGCPATSLQIRSNQAMLVISFSDNKLLEYNLEGNYIQFTTTLPALSSNVDNVISNICLDPRHPDAIIFARNNAINVLARNSEKMTSKKAKVTPVAGAHFSVSVAKSYNTVSNDEKLILNTKLYFLSS